DFNGDGKPDLAVTNQGSDSVSVLLNLSSFTGPTFDLAFDTVPIKHFGVGPTPSALAVGEFNSDGKPDLAVTDKTVDPAAATHNGVTVLFEKAPFKLFTWDGLDADGNGVPDNAPKAWNVNLAGLNPEGIVAVPAGPLKGNTVVQLLSDNGDNVYYN